LQNHRNRETREQTMHLKSRFGFEAHRDLSKHMFLSAVA